MKASAYEMYQANEPEINRQSDRPLAGMGPLGNLRFNKAAKILLNLEPDMHVRVYYQREDANIALERVPPGTTNSIKFYNQKSNRTPGLGLGPALGYFGIDKVSRRRLTVSLDGETGFILIHGFDQQSQKILTHRPVRVSNLGPGKKRKFDQVAATKGIDPYKAYTQAEAAKAAGLAIATVVALRNKGLPHRAVGRRILIIGQDLINFLKL